MTIDELAKTASVTADEAFQAWVSANEAIDSRGDQSNVDDLCERRLICLQTLSVTAPLTLTDCSNQLAVAISTETEIDHGSPMDVHWQLIRQVSSYLSRLTGS